MTHDKTPLSLVQAAGTPTCTLPGDSGGVILGFHSLEPEQNQQGVASCSGESLRGGNLGGTFSHQGGT